MSTILLILVVGALAFFLIRENTRRGANFLRAHVFLRALELGSTVEEANYLASGNPLDWPDSEVESAIRRSRMDYGGKQLPMIADARKKGMIAGNGRFAG